MVETVSASVPDTFDHLAKAEVYQGDRGKSQDPSAYASSFLLRQGKMAANENATS
jgi:hypothetical protein